MLVKLTALEKVFSAVIVWVVPIVTNPPVPAIAVIEEAMPDPASPYP